MADLIIHAIESSVLESNAPTYDQIYRALLPVNPGRPFHVGDWVGPKPRVTRTSGAPLFAGPLVVAGGDRWLTHVAWVYHVDIADNQPDLLRTVTQSLTTEVNAALAGIPHMNWGPVAVAPYSAAIDGPLDWWRSGQAAVTQTRDEFPTGTARLSATENPVGPTTPGTHPLTLGETPGAISDIATDAANRANDAVRGATNVVGTVLGVLVLGTVAYAVGPTLLGVLAAKRAAKPRANPDGGFMAWLRGVFGGRSVGPGGASKGWNAYARYDDGGQAWLGESSSREEAAQDAADAGEKASVTSAYIVSPDGYATRIAITRDNPFAGFEDFAACERAARRRGATDAGAYCGAIKHRVEDAHGKRHNPTPARDHSRRRPPTEPGAALPIAVTGLGLLGVAWYVNRPRPATPATPARVPLAPGGVMTPQPPSAPATPRPPATTPATPAPSTPATPTPPALHTATAAERTLSDALLRDAAKRKLFYFQATGYSWNLSNGTPDGVTGPNTRALVSTVQGIAGVPQTGVFSDALIPLLPNAITHGRGPRAIPQRLSADAIHAVNATALALNPNVPLLQAVPSDI